MGLSRATALVAGLPSTNDPVIQVGNLEAGAVWHYRVDGGPWVLGEGSEIPASVVVGEGTHIVQVYQQDVAGNVSGTAELQFLLDTVAPDLPTLSLKNDTGLANDLLTRDGTVLVTHVRPEDEWLYQVDDGPWQVGQGLEIPDSALGGDGTHVIRVVVRDPTGNDSPPVILTMQRDTTAPLTAPTVALEFDTGDPGDRITNCSFLHMTGLEPGARWSISLDNGATWHDAPTASTQTLRDDSLFTHDGLWQVLARQIDSAGNIGAAVSSFEFELDRIAPDAPTVVLANDTGLSANDRVTRDGTLVIGGLKPGDTWGFRMAGDILWNQMGGAEIPGDFFADGRNQVEVQMWDTAGNASDIAWIEFVLDTTAPAMPSLSLPMAPWSVAGA